MPSDADSLIAYQQQLATSTAEPWILSTPFDHRCLLGVLFRWSRRSGY
jgi:hypothetical protein